MPLQLIAPGERIKRIKGKAYPNRYYILRGEIGGVEREISTKTRDPEVAKRRALEVELAALDSRVPGPGEDLSFRKAADHYSAWRSPSKVDRGRIEKLNIILGDKLIGKLRQADLVDAANRLYHGRAAATRNREALRPAAAVLHYAAEQEWCGWLRVKLFKEPRAKTRAVSKDIAKIIISNIPELPAFERNRSERYLNQARVRQRKKRLLLLWLFRQGHRITDALKVKTAAIDLAKRTVTLCIGKNRDEEVTEALHDEVWEALVNDPPFGDRLFPWNNRRTVYKWLVPYINSLGIKFTPHMARHSLGKWLNEEGASLREIMDTLHHTDPKSSIRYQSTDIEVIRKTGRRLGKLTGES